ncbi:hypothetical protein BDB00DRAFT_826244 [Zychaea mexicana]|uniref:uncharacterized protein n=1 Tax=Zychaea mexicana TaxID=64656 RepID=UPI0022FF1FCC|nr:uncharacterized protein BDB00DRAFT_826244 [Zychaea mexicana]KAI9492943.1 hypothetical protein BDB00DRAFT_826244 [Zychaea mexicana]
MIPIVAVIITAILVLIPSAPLFIYILGCLLPKDHVVSRTKAYKNITAERLWQILTDVEAYPSWQPTLERVDFDKKETDQGRQLVYTEHTKRNKRITTTIIVSNNSGNQSTTAATASEQRQILSRVIEEDSRQRQDKPTFVGTWTFQINSTTDGEVILEIVEEGSIPRPMVRLLHLVLLGFHRRLDRFLKDLGRSIQEDGNNGVTTKKQKPERLLPSEQQTADANENKAVSTGDNTDDESSHVTDKSTTGVTMDCVTKATSMMVQDDWDFMSEIYEKPATASA